MIKIFSNGIRRIELLPQFLATEMQLFGEIEGWGDEKQKKVMRDAVVGWGHKPTADKARAYAKEKKLPYIALEDGFYRSLRLGAEGAQPLSITVDPVGVYYDASHPSQLENWLNDWKSWYTPEIQKEVHDALTLIKTADLSKYNSAPSFTEERIAEFKTNYGVREGRRMILVVDQTLGDASVALGGADDSSFRQMLEAALLEENAEVFVKTHPDVLCGKKSGYLNRLPQGVHLIAEHWAPLSFMGAFDAVYTVTSQMGFEALLIGKTVHTFGVPFYAGWGLTTDHAANAKGGAVVPAFRRRAASPSVEALFAAAALKLARYVNPISKLPCRFQEALELLAAQRSANERNRGKHVAIGFRRWKKPHVEAFLSGTESSLEFVWDLEDGLSRAEKEGAEAVIWSGKCTDEVVDNAKVKGLRLVRMEDGFIRSVGLGSDFNHPYSLVLDPDGIYYDPKRPSRLEKILKGIKKRADHDLLVERADRLKRQVVDNHLSKYNVSGISDRTVLEGIPRNRRVILVPGQVDDDASVRRGGGVIQSNRQLLEKVQQENPDAFIVYKPHPDVESGNRIGKVPQDILEKTADLVVTGYSLDDLWPYVNEVHTLTSLSGFEALLRGKLVTTYGRPFYAGFGLTSDFLTERKVATALTINELVAGAFLLYPEYWDWQTRQFCRAEDVCYRLLHREQPDVGLWIKFCRCFRNFKNVFKNEHSK